MPLLPDSKASAELSESPVKVHDNVLHFQSRPETRTRPGSIPAGNELLVRELAVGFAGRMQHAGTDIRHMDLIGGQAAGRP